MLPEEAQERQKQIRAKLENPNAHLSNFELILGDIESSLFHIDEELRDMIQQLAPGLLSYHQKHDSIPAIANVFHNGMADVCTAILSMLTPLL